MKRLSVKASECGEKEKEREAEYFLEILHDNPN